MHLQTYAQTVELISKSKLSQLLSLYIYVRENNVPLILVINSDTAITEVAKRIRTKMNHDFSITESSRMLKKCGGQLKIQPIFFFGGEFYNRRINNYEFLPASTYIELLAKLVASLDDVALVGLEKIAEASRVRAQASMQKL